jgi:hypothetical protein
MEDANMYHWDLVDENKDMLAAYPADSIMW